MDGYGYSRFCDLYGEWRKTVSATMRQTHPAGEKLFAGTGAQAARQGD
jgi:transposase